MKICLAEKMAGSDFGRYCILSENCLAEKWLAECGIYERKMFRQNRLFWRAFLRVKICMEGERQCNSRQCYDSGGNAGILMPDSDGIVRLSCVQPCWILKNFMDIFLRIYDILVNL